MDKEKIKKKIKMFAKWKYEMRKDKINSLRDIIEGTDFKYSTAVYYYRKYTAEWEEKKRKNRKAF